MFEQGKGVEKREVFEQGGGGGVEGGEVRRERCLSRGRGREEGGV